MGGHPARGAESGRSLGPRSHPEGWERAWSGACWAASALFCIPARCDIRLCCPPRDKSGLCITYRAEACSSPERGQEPEQGRGGREGDTGGARPGHKMTSPRLEPLPGSPQGMLRSRTTDRVQARPEWFKSLLLLSSIASSGRTKEGILVANRPGHCVTITEVLNYGPPRCRRAHTGGRWRSTPPAPRNPDVPSGPHSRGICPAGLAPSRWSPPWRQRLNKTGLSPGRGLA